MTNLPMDLEQLAQRLAELGATGGVTQRCVSLANGTLSPDLRVNYEFGLVLGVDEFRQEQLYHLEKSYLHNRALHGYGTVYGLQVRTNPPEGTANEVTIVVTPGMGIDQWGRTIMIRNDQCARLDAWLARQTPADINRHRRPSGELCLYVVAAYDECTDALVPIPGQPCGSSESSQAPSRIRDSFRLELRWQPPAMPAWDVVRRLARFIASLQIAPDLPPELSDKEEIIRLVRRIDTVDPLAGPAPGSSPPDDLESPPDDLESPPAAERRLRLPAATACQDLDDILLVWVTEVRPRLQPNLNDPRSSAAGQSEAGILLATLCFTQGPGGITLRGVADRGRPYLLHTQLIQQLLCRRGGEEARPAHEFATLDVRSSRSLRVWINHPELLDPLPPDALNLISDGRLITLSGVERVNPTGNSFDLFTGEDRANLIAPGAQVELRFWLGGLQVGGRPLLASLDRFGFDYVGREGDAISVYTLADRIAPTRPFVSFDTVLTDANTPRLNLWFHTDQPLRLPAQVTAQLGTSNRSITFNARPEGSRDFSFFWSLTPAGRQTIGDNTMLGFSFDTDAILAGAPDATLTSAIAEQGLALLGYDGERAIRAFYSVELPAQQQPGGISAEEAVRIAREQVQITPTLPFVTATTLIANQREFVIELWFSPAREPESYAIRINPEFFIEMQPFRVMAEVAGENDLVDLDRLNVTFTQQPNVFAVRIPGDLWRERARRSPYLRFIFSMEIDLVDADGNRVGPLGEYIETNQIKFAGHDGGNLIVAYVRLPNTGGLG